MGQNDSIITLGLELVEETEKSVGEIVAGVAEQPVQDAPQREDPGLEEARQLAQQARDYEAAENARQLQLEKDGPER
jgi:hypothetical protein